MNLECSDILDVLPNSRISDSAIVLVALCIYISIQQASSLFISINLLVKIIVIS